MKVGRTLIEEDAIQTRLAELGAEIIVTLDADGQHDPSCLQQFIAMIDEDGFIYIVGRKKLFINISGNKVDPLEVENVLLEHNKVNEAVVLGIVDDQGIETVKAVIVPQGGLQKREVIKFCQGRMSEFKIPRDIEFRDKLPRSPTGKVLREELK